MCCKCLREAGNLHHIIDHTYYHLNPNNMLNLITNRTCIVGKTKNPFKGVYLLPYNGETDLLKQTQTN